MSQRLITKFAILIAGASLCAGCSHSRMLGRGHQAAERDVVLAVREDSADFEPIETLSDSSDEIPDAAASENWGTGLWHRLRPENARHVLPRTDFWHPGATEATKASSSSDFDAGF